MIKDTEFYNKESGQYSSKRYPPVAQTYVQFFFKRRLDVLLKLLSKRYAGRSGMNLLDVGCADGIVVRGIEADLGGVFSQMIGIDIAPDMIAAAQKFNSSPNISYFIRGQEPSTMTYDAIVETGVANYTDFDAELKYADKALKPGGYYFLSIAGKGSLNDRFGRGVGYDNFLSYKEYESRISSKFVIEDAAAVGLFLPIVWMIPPLARLIQPALEAIFSIASGLFHEKIYVLKKKAV